MSNYTPTVDFSAKDALASGNPSKVILGADIDTEFTAIQTAISSKFDASSGTLTSLATDDKFIIQDTSAGDNKIITVQNILDQNSYLPASSTATTSGTSKEIATGIPRNAKRITVLLSNVSIATGPDAMFLRISSGASYDATGYQGVSWDTNAGLGSTYSGYGFEIIPYMATNTISYSGTITLTRVDSTNHIWICEGHVSSVSAATYMAHTNGRKSLTGAMDRLKIETTSALDNGAFNILVEI